MARPKQSENSVTVKERIENAFWLLLSKNDYEKISIKMLSAEASVNHNSIYYYYRNIDEIAKSAFDNTIISDLRPIMNQGFTDLRTIEEFIASQPEVATRIKRVRLFASANSIYLQTLLKDRLLNIWLSQTDKDFKELQRLDQIELDFIFSAIVSMLANKEEISIEDMEAFIQDDLGQSLLRTMKRILAFK